MWGYDDNFLILTSFLFFSKISNLDELFVLYCLELFCLNCTTFAQLCAFISLSYKLYCDSIKQMLLLLKLIREAKFKEFKPTLSLNRQKPVSIEYQLKSRNTEYNFKWNQPFLIATSQI